MLALHRPGLELLPGYVAALKEGWSPSTTRDLSASHLEKIAQDAEAFLAELSSETGTVELGDGRLVPRLPGPVYWISDGEFSGIINLRYQPGSDALPPHISGHVGYSVVPGKRRRGYATWALAHILPIARERGLTRLEVTCDEDNEASRRVILANGGRFVATRDEEGRRKQVYRIELASDWPS